MNKSVKRKSIKILLETLTFSIALLFCACAKKRDNFHHPYYLKADNFYSSGNYSHAAIYFKKYLSLFPYSARTNYKLASIYQEQEDYIQAIHYFKKYLFLEPDSQDKEIIEKWIQASEASLYKKLEKEYSDSELAAKINNTDDAKLKKELENLRRKNELMKNIIIKHKDIILKDKAPQSSSKSSGQNKSRYYTVKEGDSLYRISDKLYGSGKYYKLIWEKNKSKYTSPSNLHPGDILLIPPINGKK